MDAFLLSGFVLGLAGTAHCIGMCGPISMAIPLDRRNAFTMLTGILQYNFGRILMYATIGFVIGSIGFSVKLIGFLQGLSIISGVLLIFYAYKRYWSTTEFKEYTPAFLSKFISQGMGKTLASDFPLRRVGLGILNGLLPCGMVYAALIGSLVSAHPIQGASYMIFFGLGTLPCLILVAFSAQLIGLKTRAFLQKFSPYMLILVGSMLVLRGMNLDIPYLSPSIKVNQTTGAFENTACHESSSYCPSPVNKE